MPQNVPNVYRMALFEGSFWKGTLHPFAARYTLDALFGGVCLALSQIPMLLIIKIKH